MKHLHVHVSVEDLDTSMRLYSTMFAAAPTVQRPTRNKWKTRSLICLRFA